MSLSMKRGLASLCFTQNIIFFIASVTGNLPNAQTGYWSLWYAISIAIGFMGFVPLFLIEETEVQR